MTTLSADERLAAILAGSADAILATDTRGIITDWNPAAEQLYGYARAEAVGSDIVMLIPPDRRGEKRTILDTVRAGDRVERFETERLRKDGSRVQVSLTISPLRAPDGTVVGVSTIARSLEGRDAAERALADSERRFRTLVEAAPDPILGVEDSGRISFVSSRIRDVLGYEPEELVGKPVESLVPERLRAGHVVHRSEFATSPSIRPMGAGGELFALHKDGSEVPVEISLGHTRTGTSGLTTAIVIDVSARRAAESDQALLSSLVVGSGDAILSISREGTILTWNPAAEEMFGVPAEQAVGRSFDEALITTTDAAARREMGRQVFDEGRTLRYEGVRPGTRGRTLEVSVSVSPVRDAGGTVVAACAICRDMSAQKAAEAQTLQLAAIVDASLDPIFAIRPDGTVISWNAAAERLYAIPARDAIGTQVEDLLPDPEGDRRRLRERVKAGETVFDHAATRVLPDGRRIELSITSFPIHDGDEIVAIATIVRDISERRRLEDRLRQTERLEAVGRLAGGVAHDFNNLLTVITGYSAIAQTFVSPGAGAEELEEVRRAASRASALTGRLLDFSRQRTVDPVRLDLTETVEGLMPMLERLIGEDIRVVVLTDELVPLVLADRSQIEQVVVNLAVNARDAMPEGGTLTIETRAITVSQDEASIMQLAPGRWACLTVSDSGSGIPPEAIEHVFEPFFTTKDVGKGTGLGLATVHGIVGQAGGEVRVYSEPGLGASFKVFLPGVESEAPTRQTPPAASPERPGDHATVLLCEDEPAVAALLERMLTRAGYQVLRCAAPDEALRVAASNPGGIDVLVSDVIMPGLTGPQLAERLIAEHGALPTLFLSGYTADVIRDRGHLPAGSAFLEKPFEPAELLTALRTLLAERPNARDGGGVD